MKAMSQAERTEVQTVLKKRLDAKKSELNANDPGWSQRVEDRKRKVAIGRLKVQKEVAELESIEEQIRELEKKCSAVEARIHSKMPLEKRRYRNTCPDHKDLCTAIGDICEEIHDQEMAKDKTGKKAHKLNNEYQESLAKLAGCTTRQDVVDAGIL